MIKTLSHYARLPLKEARASYQKEYQWYPGFGSWCIRVYDRLLRKAPRLPLPGRKSTCRLRFRSMETPFYVRLGSSDLQLHQTIRFRGEYRPIMENPCSGDIRQVVDLGANAGFTVRLWRELFPRARIIAVEPDEGNMRVCRLNAEALPGVQLDFIQACVDGKPGSVLLDRSEAEHQFHMTTTASAQTVSVEALTVPQILERVQANPRIGLLKCDVQGAEQSIFADCRSWISRVENMIIEVHPPYTGDALIADLQRNGWKWNRLVTHKTDNLWVLFFWGS